jgi:3-hydroxyacyl-[acyl-carrier-protein] dehydratase
MPPEQLLALDSINPDELVVDRDEIYRLNPHRFEFALLDGLCYLDMENLAAAAVVNVRDDAFWVRGHIPGRPLMPGVLMIEAAAQLVSYLVKRSQNLEQFFGFAGVDDVKFRGQVTPGDQLVLLGKLIELRRKRRAVGRTQAFVNGRMVYEGTIVGMAM